MRDFSETVFEDDHDLYIYNDSVKESEPGKAIKYVWWNGDNPNGKNLYRFYEPTHIWPEFREYDYETWYENVMRPLSKKKPPKLYAMKVFNGRQHIKLHNIGPFGGMFVPYNLPEYYKMGIPIPLHKKRWKKV